MLSKFIARSGLVLLPLFAVACGGSSSDEAESIGTDASAFATLMPGTGDVSVVNPHAGKLITGFVFTNDGSSDVTISNAVVTLTTGKVISAGFGFGVAKGGEGITFVFDPTTTHEVAKLTFTIDGSTEKLVVTETDRTGAVPGRLTPAQ